MYDAQVKNHCTCAADIQVQFHIAYTFKNKLIMCLNDAILCQVLNGSTRLEIYKT